MSFLPALPGEPAPVRLVGNLVDWVVIGMGATMIGLVFMASPSQRPAFSLIREYQKRIIKKNGNQKCH